MRDRLKTCDAPALARAAFVRSACGVCVCGCAGDEGIDLFFKGDTAKLNQFLSRLSKVKKTRLEVTLFPEPGRAWTRKASFIGPDGIDRANKPFSYNWHLNAWRAPVLESEPAQGPQVTKTRLRPSWGEWVITVYVSVHGDISLRGISLPLEFHAAVGGRLGNFVNWHNERRDEERAGELTTRDSQPSTMKLMTAPSLFGVDPQDATEPLTREDIRKMLKNLLEEAKREQDPPRTSQPARPRR